MTKIEDFGAKADLTRITVSITATGTTVTTTTPTFVSSDLNKVICIKDAAAATAYGRSQATLTAKITAYTDSQTVTISVAATNTITNGDAYFYTNNYDAIQDAIDHCETNGIGILFAQSEGVFGIDPWMTSTPPTDPDNLKDNGFQMRESSLNIIGGGKGVTSFKWCIEDNFETVLTDRYMFSGFVIRKSGDFIFEDFTMLAPDRLTTEFVNQRCNGFTLSPPATAPVTKINATLTLRNVDIVGDENSWYEYFDLQWADGIVSSSTESDVQMYLYNVTTKTGTQGVSQFDGDGDKQSLTIQDLNVYYGGAPLLTLDYGDGTTTGISITNGTNVLTVNVPGFSFYDLGLFDDYDYLKIHIDDTTSFVIDTSQPMTATSVQTTANATATYSNTAFYITRDDANSKRTFGHSLYIHPSITMIVNGYTAYYANGYRMHVYSSSGTEYGAKYRFLDNMNFYDEDNPLFPGLLAPYGWLMSTAQTDINIIRNSNIIYAANAREIDYKFYDTTFSLIGESADGPSFYGNVELVGCTMKDVRSWTDSKTVTLKNCYVDREVAVDNGGIIDMYNTSYDYKRAYPEDNPPYDGDGIINSNLNMSFKLDELVYKYFNAKTGFEVPGVGGMYTTSPKSTLYLKNVIDDDYSVAVFDGKDGQTADTLRVRRDDGEDNFTVSNDASTDVHQGLTIANRLTGEDILKILKGSPATTAISVDENGETDVNELININDGLNLKGELNYHVTINKSKMIYGVFPFAEFLHSSANVGHTMFRLNNTVDGAWNAFIIDAKNGQSADIMQVRDHQSGSSRVEYFTISGDGTTNIKQSLHLSGKSGEDVLKVQESGTDKLTITEDIGLKMTTTTDTFSPPKLTTTERNNLTAAAGDIIYNTTDNKHQGYDGTSWNNMY